MSRVISLHIRSTWETICDAQAGFCTHSSNSKFLSKFSRKALSGISDQKAPLPPMKNFRFEMTKVYSRIPPPPWKTSDLRWPKFTPEYSPPPWKTSDLRWPKFTPEYPPPPIGLQSWRSYVESNLYPLWIPLIRFGGQISWVIRFCGQKFHGLLFCLWKYKVMETPTFIASLIRKI